MKWSRGEIIFILLWATFVFFAILPLCSCAAEKVAYLNDEEVIIPAEAPQDTVDLPTKFSNEYSSLEPILCNREEVHALCDTRGGPGVFLFIDACGPASAMQMTEKETELICDGVFHAPSPLKEPPISIESRCVVPGFCGPYVKVNTP